MQQNKAGLSQEAFRGVVDGKAVQLYTLINKAGAEAHFINQGAKLVSLVVPSRTGYTDVVLGHDSLDEYIHSEEAYFGAICGRYANRIVRGHFTIDGTSYELPINNGPNSLPSSGMAKSLHLTRSPSPIPPPTAKKATQASSLYVSSTHSPMKVSSASNMRLRLRVLR